LEKAIEAYKQACLRAFNITKRGKDLKKTAFPKPREVTVNKDSAKF
jgi:hypothetical protein